MAFGGHPSRRPSRRATLARGTHVGHRSTVLTATAARSVRQPRAGEPQGRRQKDHKARRRLLCYQTAARLDVDPYAGRPVSQPPVSYPQQVKVSSRPPKHSPPADVVDKVLA